MKMKLLQVLIFRAILFGCVFAPAALTQTSSPAPDMDETSVSGTVVSSSKNTLVVKTGTNLYQLFVFDHDTLKPHVIHEGAEVTVTSVATAEPGLRHARHIVIATGGSTEKPAESTNAQSTNAQSTKVKVDAEHAAPLPASAQHLQNEIEREARKFGVGFRTGVGLDPEVMLVGVHARLGPIFSRDITFRPNAEFGFGEVTKFFALNAEAAYRLPLTPRWAKWSIYVGGGPSFGFTHQNFEKTNIDFGDLKYAGSLNLLSGMESRNGFFVETKATLWASASPKFRLIFGWTF